MPPLRYWPVPAVSPPTTTWPVLWSTRPVTGAPKGDADRGGEGVGEEADPPLEPGTAASQGPAAEDEDAEGTGRQAVADDLVEVVGGGGPRAGLGLGVELEEVGAAGRRVGDADGVASHEILAEHGPHAPGHSPAHADGGQPDAGQQEEGQHELAEDGHRQQPSRRRPEPAGDGTGRAEAVEGPALGGAQRETFGDAVSNGIVEVGLDLGQDAADVARLSPELEQQLVEVGLDRVGGGHAQAGPGSSRPPDQR